METLWSQTAVKNRNVNQKKKKKWEKLEKWQKDLPWMSFVSTLRLTGSLFVAWSWPGMTEINCPEGPSLSSRASTIVLDSLKCVVNPHAPLSVFNRALTVRERFKGSVISLSCAKVSVFGDGAVWLMLPAETFVSVTRFCKELGAVSVSARLTDSHSFSRQLCLLSASSEPPVSHPRGETRADVLTCEFSRLGVWYVGTLSLFFCDCVFTLRQGPELIPQARFFALSIPKRHFSLRFLHIQSCILQYKRLLARLETWETPLIEDMNPFFLLRYFAVLRWLCVRCIWERLFRVSDGGSHESMELWVSFQLLGGQIWVR